MGIRVTGSTDQGTGLSNQQIESQLPGNFTGLAVDQCDPYAQELAAVRSQYASLIHQQKLANQQLEQQQQQMAVRQQHEQQLQAQLAQERAALELQ